MVNGSLKKLDRITKISDTYSIETKHTNGIKIMRFEVVNEQFGFIGKIEERAKIEKAINALLSEIESSGCIEDDECDYTDTLEISYEYDMDAYTVADIKAIWKRVKKLL